MKFLWNFIHGPMRRLEFSRPHEAGDIQLHILRVNTLSATLSTVGVGATNRWGLSVPIALPASDVRNVEVI